MADLDYNNKARQAAVAGCNTHFGMGEVFIQGCRVGVGPLPAVVYDDCVFVCAYRAPAVPPAVDQRAKVC